MLVTTSMVLIYVFNFPSKNTLFQNDAMSMAYIYISLGICLVLFIYQIYARKEIV